MEGLLMDVYRKDNSIILWIKTPEHTRLAFEFTCTIYLDAVPLAKDFLHRHRIMYTTVERKTYLHEGKRVYAITIKQISRFEEFVRWIEKETRHRVALYNADISPEQMFMYKNHVVPGRRIIFEHGRIFGLQEDNTLPLTSMNLVVTTQKNSNCITSIRVGEKNFVGIEREILACFVDAFKREDPDVILMDRGFKGLPLLVKRLQEYGFRCSFNRWDEKQLNYKGGKTMYTYGRVQYRDFSIHLNARFLVDTSTMVGSQCEPDAIMELCALSGTRFQNVAGRSFGAVFQSSLVKTMIEQDLLVPFKEKPIEKAMSMLDLVKADRAGHTFDPKIGFHANVAELDFSSMYPWLIYNRNISAETITITKEPLEHVPGIPVTISLRHKGLVPQTIKPLLDRRMEYKKKPTAFNKARAVGLKWVLVSAFGYLRFREFKLGIASSHMSVGSYARETILEAAHLAEENGFEILHGIVDSLYIRKKDMTAEHVKELCKEIEQLTGIPMSFEGIFKWVVFLPSIQDHDRPVPARYYGVFQHGGIKARGIEVRQRGTPLIVRLFQQHILEYLSTCKTQQEIIQTVPFLCRQLREVILRLSCISADLLSCTITISKNHYTRSSPQKTILQQLLKKGLTQPPGTTIQFIYQQNKAVLPEDYTGNPDMKQYKRMLIRSLYILLQPFGITNENITENISTERQTKVNEYIN